MAVGDIAGDLATAYMTPEERAAQQRRAASVGPVARAQQQLPVAATPSLASAAPQAATQPTSQQVSQQVVTPPVTTIPAAPAPQAASLANAYRPTGSGNIVGRTGANGVPEFSNLPADVRTAQGQALLGTPAAAGSALSNQASLAQLAPGASSSPEFSSIGSMANIGDGVGTFSQANQGDAALSLARFGRANDIRRAGQDQDRLDLATARNAQGGNLTVVRDSSQPLTRSDLMQAQLDQASRQGLADNVTAAQNTITGRRQGQAQDQQLRQATRLEDLANAASAPGANPDARAAYLAATDPTGEKATARQLAQTQVANAQTEGLIKQQTLAQNAQTAQTTQQTQATQRTSSLDIAKQARDLAQSIGSNNQFDSITGTIDSRTPTVVGSSRDLINQANRLQTLLTADNLKLMSGVLTDRDITFLTQIGSGLNVGENGINGSEEGSRKVLGEITSRLNQKIADYEKLNKPQGSAAPAAASIPTVSSKAQADALPAGSTFIGPDGKQYRK